jgi:hypothetical protein
MKRRSVQQPSARSMAKICRRCRNSSGLCETFSMGLMPNLGKRGACAQSKTYRHERRRLHYPGFLPPASNGNDLRSDSGRLSRLEDAAQAHDRYSRRETAAFDRGQVSLPIVLARIDLALAPIGVSARGLKSFSRPFQLGYSPVFSQQTLRVILRGGCNSSILASKYRA